MLAIKERTPSPSSCGSWGLLLGPSPRSCGQLQAVNVPALLAVASAIGSPLEYGCAPMIPRVIPAEHKLICNIDQQSILFLFLSEPTFVTFPSEWKLG